MKKAILNLGKNLNKTQQKNILGGAELTYVPEEGSECIEGMCSNMPNPDYNMGAFDPLGGPDQNGNVFVQGVCRDGQCYYA
jgi:hypothetical protein